MKIRRSFGRWRHQRSPKKHCQHTPQIVMRAGFLLRAATDPWARREAWRYQGQFARKTVYKNLWPGFSYGVGAFVVYVIAEKLFFPPAHHEHEEHNEH